MASTARFWLQVSRRQALRDQLTRCRNLDDYYAFAASEFPPVQIRAEMIALLNRLAAERPRCACEIGTADGGTNCLLVHALPSVEFMLGIDLFVKGKARLRHFASPRQQLHYIDGSSYLPVTVERAREVLAGRQLDVLFIDGDHSYRGVSADFRSYRGFVRDGGLVVFHDICPDFKTRYGRETGHWAGDVPRLWGELKAFYPHEEFVQDPEQDGLGIGLLRYSPSVELPDNL
jgi:cephalosporin hydroxylase